MGMDRGRKDRFGTFSFSPSPVPGVASESSPLPAMQLPV